MGLNPHKKRFEEIYRALRIGAPGRAYLDKHRVGRIGKAAHLFLNQKSSPYKHSESYLDLIEQFERVNFNLRKAYTAPQHHSPPVGRRQDYMREAILSLAWILKERDKPKLWNIMHDQTSGTRTYHGYNVPKLLEEYRK